MATQQFNTNVDVNGEVKGTSLDINGNADISGNLTSASWTGDEIATTYTAAKVTSIVQGEGTLIATGTGDVTVAATVPNIYGNQIKLLPSDFVANDDSGTSKVGIAYKAVAGSSYGMKPNASDTELFAFVSIPRGMKATHVDIYDKYNKGVIVYEAQINATTLTSKGTGNCNTQIDITDVNASATNFLAIEVTTTATSDRVYGGSVTIAAI